jgi:hypothetical protein
MKIRTLMLFLFLVSTPSFAADYCLGHLRSGAESAPTYFLEVECSTGETFTTKHKWCLSLRQRNLIACTNQVLEIAKKELAARGYSWVAGFHDGRPEIHDHLFQKTTAIDALKFDYCWASRFPTHRGDDVRYRIRCDGRSVVELDGLDAGESTQGITRYMQNNGGFYLVDTIWLKGHWSSKLIFARDQIGRM